MFCRRCGNEMAADDKFCSKCGFSYGQNYNGLSKKMPSIPDIKVDLDKIDAEKLIKILTIVISVFIVLVAILVSCKLINDKNKSNTFRQNYTSNNGTQSQTHIYETVASSGNFFSDSQLEQIAIQKVQSYANSNYSYMNWSMDNSWFDVGSIDRSGYQIHVYGTAHFYDRYGNWDATKNFDVTINNSGVATNCSFRNY